MIGLVDRGMGWWQERALRERRMLAVMFIALAAFIAWYGISVPLRGLRDDARARHERAASELLATQTAAREIEDPGRHALRTRSSTIADWNRLMSNRLSPSAPSSAHSGERIASL